MDARTLCLAVLLRGPASGYEIKKTLGEAPYAHFQDTGFASIYPALTRLAGEGLAECTQFAQEKRPDKKVYWITPAGRTALTEALSVMPGPDRYRSDFLFILLFGELLPREHIARIVDERIAFYETQIARMAECRLDGCPATKRVVHGFGLMFYRAAADYLRAQRATLLAAAAGAAKAAE